MNPAHIPRWNHNGSFVPHRARSAAFTLTAAAALLVSTGVAQASPAPASVDLAGADNVDVLAESEVTSELPEAFGGVAAEDALADAVIEDVLPEYGSGLSALDSEDREVRVDIRETDGESAFGVAIVTAPMGVDEEPYAWLFSADHEASGWTVGLEGSEEFSSLLADSELLDEEARDTVSTSTNPAEVSPNSSTGVGLPFEVGTSMRMTGGPHGEVGQSVDFAGGAGLALAARGGYAYSLCDGWTRVIHDNGHSTDYYHLEDYQWLDGDVSTGHYLGTQGNSLCAGGDTTGAHIHFSLRGYDDPNAPGWFLPVDGREMGGWTFVQGEQYGGYAYRDGVGTVYPGGEMHNYGF